MHRRNNIHSLLIACSSDYISSAWPSISPQSLCFKQSSVSRHQREGKEHVFSYKLKILLLYLQLFSSGPFLSFHQYAGVYSTSQTRNNHFLFRLVAPLKYSFIFPFSLTVDLQLKVGFTSLTSPTLSSLLSLSFTVRTFQKS